MLEDFIVMLKLKLLQKLIGMFHKATVKQPFENQQKRCRKLLLETFR